MGKIKLEYNAKIDSKKRLTVRDASFEYYHVYEFSDGTVLLRPRVLFDPNEISKNTLAMMDKSINNLKKGKVSSEINLNKYLPKVKK